MTLELKNIAKVVGGAPHIHDASLTLSPGGFNILLGATNAGKSTLIKIMAGLERPTRGTIHADGRDVTGMSAQRRGIALVHQFFVNYPHLTVYENIASPLRVARVPREEIDGRVRAAADVLQLGPMLQRRPHELSGGQQQRTALARAIVKDARAIFLDEPLANLDYKLREELREQLPDILGERGTVVVYATSEPTEALLLGGHTALVHEGRIAQFGPTAEVYRRPRDLAAARVFSDPPINLAPVTKQGDRVRFGPAQWQVQGEAAALADGPYTIGIRPHHVAPTPVADAVALTGRIAITELSGSESVAHFDIEGRSWVSLSPGVHPFRVGETHQFHMTPHRCLYFGPDGALAARGAAHG
ncbi:MAG: ABC transporter ATP-binding protein [Pseudomonadota bacterium]